MRVQAFLFTALLIAGIEARGALRRAHPYRRQYVKETFGPKPLAGAGARAGIARVWHGGSLGGHVARGLGMHVIDNSIKFPVAALRHEDLHYYPSTEKGFWPRLRHAMVSTVVTRKTTSGSKTVAAGRISGAMGSGMIAATWAPAAAGGVATGGISLGAAAAGNVAREFWPKHRQGPRTAAHHATLAR